MVDYALIGILILITLMWAWSRWYHWKAYKEEKRSVDAILEDAAQIQRGIRWTQHELAKALARARKAEQERDRALVELAKCQARDDL